MPGLILPFAPIYLLTHNQEISFNGVIVFQFILSTVSVYMLGLISNLIFNSNRVIFILTILFYSLWYHISDHYLQADSIANSTLIISFYFFLLSFKSDFTNYKHIFLSGFFFNWSIFCRLIAIVPFTLLFFVIFYFLIIKKRKPLNFLLSISAFIVCFFICESMWVIRNKMQLNRTVLFTQTQECYSSYSYNWGELIKIPTAWGCDITPWSGDIYWWLDSESKALQFPYPKSCFTKSFNAERLTDLKNKYHSSFKNDPFHLNEELKNEISLYLKEYRNENFFNYYVLHPFKLLIKFYYKKTIVDMPFPPLSEMNLFHKIIKLLNWIFILIISLLFLGAPLFLIKNRNQMFVLFLIIPISISFFLVWFGGIEQRYFWPIIPFCVIFFAFLINFLYLKFKSNSFLKLFSRN
jgi:hypothetical protein